MPTNSTFGWPITNKSDMFKPTAISALEGAAFDTRVTLERARHEKRVATTAALPSVGDYVGQQAWVDNRNRPYYWTGASWKAANGFETGTITLSGVNWAGSAMPLRWTGEMNIALPAGRYTAAPNVVVNAYADDRVVWGSVSRPPTTTSFSVRLICIAPGSAWVRVYWAAFDSN